MRVPFAIVIKQTERLPEQLLAQQSVRSLAPLQAAEKEQPLEQLSVLGLVLAPSMCKGVKTWSFLLELR
jgi:hypothetical protein